MGRPLKIKKSTTVDIGYPNFNSLDPSTAVIPTGMTGTEYLGVVGGETLNGIPTVTNPVVQVYANLPGGDGTAFIVTQKGNIKYLVGGVDSVSAGSFTPGYSYVITSLGTTNWTAIGAGINPQVGQVFTATGVGSGTGTASDCDQCVLVPSPDNSTAPTLNVGEMYIAFTVDGVTKYASKLTNKYIWDSATTPEKFAVNFFVGDASSVGTAGSGADIPTWTNGNGTYSLAVVDNFTS